MNLSPRSVGVLQILLASIGFGFLGTLSRLAKAEGLETGTLLTYRFSLATILLFIYLLIQNPKQLKLPKKEIYICFGLGIFGYSVFSTLYFTSIQTVSIALAALLLYTYPFWIMILKIILGHRPRRNEILLLFGALGGMMMLLWGPLQMNSSLGILCGLGSAITYSIYILVSEKHQQNVSALVASGYIMASATLGLWLFHSPLSHSPTELSSRAWLILFGISILSTIFPLTLTLSGLQKLESSTVSLISLSEPVTAILLSSLIFSENLAGLQITGAITVLSLLGLKFFMISRAHKSPRN